MNIINPTVGDLTDRLTILSLKVLFGTAAGQPVEHFIQERTGILTKLRTRQIGPWMGLLSDLAAVNGALWHAEEDLRGCQELVDAGRLGLRIQALNDQRAALIVKINKEAGDPTNVEKLP
jgi:hypothetical protein